MSRVPGGHNGGSQVRLWGVWKGSMAITLCCVSKDEKLFSSWDLVLGPSATAGYDCWRWSSCWWQKQKGCKLTSYAGWEFNIKIMLVHSSTVCCGLELCALWQKLMAASVYKWPYAGPGWRPVAEIYIRPEKSWLSLVPRPWRQRYYPQCLGR